MNSNIYEYHLLKTEDRKKRLNRILQYRFSVNDLISSDQINYKLYFYRFKSYLFITDYFPETWENNSNRVNKLLCKEENKRVNIRKITLTCIGIFHNEISAKNMDAAFVANGSLVVDEKKLPELNISRKLNIYWTILKPWAKQFNYRIIEVLEYNAIILIKNESKLSDQQIRDDYIEFKEG